MARLVVVVKFPTSPPMTTTIDVHETGDIPILLSLPHMMNLGFQLSLEPGAVRLTCKHLAMNLNHYRFRGQDMQL